METNERIGTHEHAIKVAVGAELSKVEPAEPRSSSFTANDRSSFVDLCVALFARSGNVDPENSYGNGNGVHDPLKMIGGGPREGRDRIRPILFSFLPPPSLSVAERLSSVRLVEFDYPARRSFRAARRATSTTTSTCSRRSREST